MYLHFHLNFCKHLYINKIRKIHLHLISTESPLDPLLIYVEFPTSWQGGDQVGVSRGFSGDDFWINI